MNHKTLTPRQTSLCICAACAAQGDLQRLKTAIARALEDGATVSELKEVFSQLYAYVGFPRALNALGVLQQQVESLSIESNDERMGKSFTSPHVWSNAEETLRMGTAMQTRLTGGKPFDYAFCPQIDHYLKAHLFGDIFASDILSPNDRELVTVAALSALHGVAPQLAAHKAGAVNMGNSEEQVTELLQLLSSLGLTAADHSAEAQTGAWPKGQPNDAYAQYFKGHSFLAPLAAANLKEGEKPSATFANVTFEPGCRNNWHIHHGAHQILIS